MAILKLDKPPRGTIQLVAYPGTDRQRRTVAFPLPATAVIRLTDDDGAVTTKRITIEADGRYVDKAQDESC